MRILFSNPPWWEPTTSFRRKKFKVYRNWRRGVRAGSRWPFTSIGRSGPDRFKFGDYLPYPFFMGYATTYVKKHTGAHVVMRDSIALAESYKSYYDYVKNEKFDYIFIESATPSWDHDLGVIKRLAKLTSARIVVAGPIATLDQAVLNTGLVHACIKGEYEKGSVKVIEGQSGVIDFDLLSKEEMNDAPFPYYDDTIAHRYSDDNPIGQIKPHAHVWSSRGCPYKCIFCVWPAAMTGNDPDGSSKRTVRHYSPEYMEAFLTELVEKYRFKSIYFDDDTFNLGNNHVVKMCEVMSRVGIPWSAMCRADTIKLETWKTMSESGCFGVKLGFESGNQWVVDNIVNKFLNLETAREAVHEIKRLGMSVHGTFTYGLPGETREHMQDTKRYIASLPFDTYQESGTAEIEGTPLATLRNEETLEKYPGAQLDGSYILEKDGNKKMAEMARVLRES